MKWVAYILWFAAAVLAIGEQIKDKPGKQQTIREKLIRWRMRIIAGIITLAAAGIHQFPQDTDIPSDNLHELSCDVDTVKSLLRQALGSEDKKYLDAAREEAECIEASQLARTARDSAIVAAGLAKYSTAIIHLQYVLWAATDDLAKGETYADMGLIEYLWGLSLPVEDDQKDRDSHIIQAVIHYDSALVYKYSDFEIWNDCGAAQYYLEEFTAAVASFDSAIVYKFDFAETWSNRCAALYQLKEFTAAIASCDSAIAYKYDLAEAWHNRGLALYNRGELISAAASRDSAAKYDAEQSKDPRLK